MSRPDKTTAPGLDRDSYEPAYAQVVRILSQEIAQGLYRPGDQLPSESQLCARFGVSGMTIRRAINILVARGVVSASQGKGTFVRGLDVRETAFRLRERYEEEVLGPGAEVHLLHASILAADERVARKLGVRPGTRAILEHIFYDFENRPSRGAGSSAVRIASGWWAASAPMHPRARRSDHARGLCLRPPAGRCRPGRG